MSTPNTWADRFALLFSADWFRPHWSLTGFVPKGGKDTAFQQEVRKIVERMLDNDDCYWRIHFTNERLKDTREALLTALDSYKSEGSDLSLIGALVMGESPQEALTDVSTAFWDAYEARLADINGAHVTATDWDQRLATLTPDLPDYLQTLAWALLRGDALMFGKR